MPDPKQLEERIQQWNTDMQPRNAVECELVCHAARLSWAVGRGSNRVYSRFPGAR